MGFDSDFLGDVWRAYGQACATQMIQVIKLFMHTCPCFCVTVDVNVDVDVPCSWHSTCRT